MNDAFRTYVAMSQPYNAQRKAGRIQADQLFIFKMLARKCLPIALAVGCLAVFLNAQPPGETKNDQPGKSKLFSIEGTYRLRGELLDAFNIRAFGTGAQEDFLLSRLRLEANLRLAANSRIHAQIQDAETLGLSFSDKDFSGGNNPFHDPFDINQFYLEWWPIKKVGLKIGRQAISYGDRRVFGPGDWGNTGRYAWDALKLEIDGKSFSSHWLVGRFVLHDPDRWPNTHAGGPTAYASYNTIRNLPFNLDIFYVYKYDGRGSTKGEGGTGDLSSHSAGLRIEGQGGRWDYSAMVANQFGRWGPDNIRTHGFTLSLGYAFDTRWKPHLIAQYVLGSGDKNPTDGIHGTFDGIFSGADTVLYGWMNLFFWQNLREFRIDLILTPQKTLTLRGEYHLFGLDEPTDAWYFPGKALRRDVTGSSGRFLGHEVDLTVRKKLSGWLELLSGACFFLPGEFVKKTGGSPIGQWYFLETTFYF